MTAYKLRYLVLPDFLYTRSDLTAIQIKIMAFLVAYTRERFYFSNEQLAEMFNVEPQSVSRSIRGLVKKGLVVVDYEIKAGGGKVRFITQHLQTTYPRLNPNDESDSTKMMSLYKGIKDNKVKDKTPLSPVVETASRVDEVREFVSEFNRLFGKSYRYTTAVFEKYQARKKTYTTKEMQLALTNLASSSWHRGENEKGWTADPLFLLRNDEQIDKWLNTTPTPVKPVSAKDMLV